MRNDNLPRSFKSRNRTRLLASVASLAAAGLLLGACGNSPPTVRATDTTTTTGSGYTHPTGSGDVVLRVHTAGGFVPLEWALSDVAEITVYGDGRVLLLENEGERAVAVLAEYRVTEDGLQRILAAADEAGLLGDAIDYGMPPVTDMPTTVVEVVTDEAHVNSAYALDFEEDATGLTAEQEEARRALRDLVADLLGLVEWLGDDASPAFAPYTPDVISVYSRVLQDGETADDTLAWPLADLAAAGEPLGPDGEYRCVAVSGDDLRTVVEAARSADISTVWTSGGETYRVTFAVVLPDGEACTDLAFPS